MNMAEKHTGENTAERASASTLSNNSSYTNIQKAAYRRFQLYWIADHGFGINDIINALVECAAEIISDDETLDAEILKELFEETGLGEGSLYPCMDEFLDYEYTDARLMQQLLTEDEFRQYLKERRIKAF